MGCVNQSRANPKQHVFSRVQGMFLLVRQTGSHQVPGWTDHDHEEPGHVTHHFWTGQLPQAKGANPNPPSNTNKQNMNVYRAAKWASPTSWRWCTFTAGPRTCPRRWWRRSKPPTPRARVRYRPNSWGTCWKIGASVSAPRRSTGCFARLMWTTTARCVTRTSSRFAAPPCPIIIELCNRGISVSLVLLF